MGWCSYRFIPYLLVFDAFSNLLLYYVAFRLKNKKQSLSSLSVQPNMNGTSFFSSKKAELTDGCLAASIEARDASLGSFAFGCCTRRCWQESWRLWSSEQTAGALEGQRHLPTIDPSRPFARSRSKFYIWHAQWDTWQCVGVSQLRFLKAVFSLIFDFLYLLMASFLGFMWHYHVSSCLVTP